MKKQFELSTYGVEEMTQKELLEINGGVWQIIGPVFAILSILFQVLDERTGNTEIIIGSFNDLKVKASGNAKVTIIHIDGNPGYEVKWDNNTETIFTRAMD